MCGPLCDAILGEQGSGDLLDQMEARNLLVVPLDRHREWYRYHHLLRDLLQAELRRREPGLVLDLHFRAAAWFEANAMPEAAIGHAHAAGDYDRVARLILELQQPVWASGRVETVLYWMTWLRDITSAEHYGAVAAHGSLIFARSWDSDQAAGLPPRGGVSAGVLPTEHHEKPPLGFLIARELVPREDIAEMRRDARIAWEG
jgi:LuxR family maltose regulon positive regulatory protein